ncbi:phage terminase large subunit family protein [Salmonella enterica]
MIELLRLTPGERRALAGRDRFHVIAAGELAGKTSCAISALHYFIENGQRCAWFACNDAELQRARNRIRDIYDDVVHKSEPQKLSFSNTAAIDFYDYSNLSKAPAGDYAFVIFDDAHKMSELNNFWRDYGRDLVRERNGGEALFCGNPLGKHHEFYELWRRGEYKDGWSNALLTTTSNSLHLTLNMLNAMRECEDDERKQRFEAVFLEHHIALSASHKVLRVGETFRQWCERLAADGLKVDGHPFKLDDRPAMAWIYDQIPGTKAEARNRMIVLMKCAQVGFTVMEMLVTIYWGLRFPGLSVGMFLPSTQLSNYKSSERFVPIINSVPEIKRLVSEGEDGAGNVRTRRIGSSIYHFLWTSGRVSTESIPMDAVSLDEVQGMIPAQIEKVRERLSGSFYRTVLAGSTPNAPGNDIDYLYQQGTQHRFFTECPHCGHAEPMDQRFPQNTVQKPDSSEYHYICLECGGVITDTQRGQWVATYPERAEGENPVVSIHFPQFLSPTITATDLGRGFATARSRKTFFNHKLGKPYLDPDSTPVTMANMPICAAAGEALAVRWESKGDDYSTYYLGFDHMSNLNVHLIKKRLPSGHMAVVLFEQHYSENPFERTHELMELFNIKCAVAELNPNANESRNFARAFPGRAYLVTAYGVRDDLIIWHDRAGTTASERRTADEYRSPFTCAINQYGMMSYSLNQYTGAAPRCVIPSIASAPTTENRTNSGMEQVNSAELLFKHLSATALITEIDDVTTKAKHSVCKLGFDPHGAFADLLCDVAIARDREPAMLMIPDPITGQIAFDDDPLPPIGEIIVPQVREAVAVVDEGRKEQAQAMLNGCGACKYCVDYMGKPTCRLTTYTTSRDTIACELFNRR